MGIHPPLHQKGNGQPHVDHHQALSGLSLGLVTPRDLPGCNTDEDMWLMLLLHPGFSQLRPQLGHLEPARGQTILFNDQDIKRPK